MLLSKTAEYALRASVCLGDSRELLRTTQEIAEATHVPAGYLYKVLQALCRADLVSSRRGLHGGYTLNRPAEQISLLEVINAVDPVQRIRRCPLGLGSHDRQLCSLHSRVDKALAIVERTFARTSVADLFNEGLRDRPTGNSSDPGIAIGDFPHEDVHGQDAGGTLATNGEVQ